MSEDSATADANLREIARLRVELRLLRSRPAVEAELVERGAELLVVLADAPADLVRPNSAPDTLRAVLAEVARLRRWAALWKGTAKLLRGRLQYQTRRRIYWRTRYHEAIVARDQLARELAQARERERIAAEAYNGQQTSQRELETLYQDALRRLAEMQTLQAGAAVLRNALQWYADRVYSHTMGLPPEVQWIAEDALKRTTAGVEPADANPTRAQLLGAQSALRNAMEQAEASKRLIAGMLGQAPAEPADDDGHGKPYLNEM